MSGDIVIDRIVSEELDDGHPNYTRVHRFGKGAHGSVWYAHRRHDSREVALKYVEAMPDMKVILMREVYNHFKLEHAHIVHLNHVTYHNGFVVLEMEAMKGGDMERYMRNYPHGLPEHIARWYFQQIVLAVDYCHSKYVCNRDIKLENILLTQPPSAQVPHPQIKLCDFGWSKDEAGDSAPKTKAGTPAYVAPEILLGQVPYDGDAADAWSLGVLLYCLVVGKLPFRRDDDRKLNRPAKLTVMTSRIIKGDYHFPENITLSPGVRDLISRLLTLDPGTRIKIPQVMAHDWFFQNCTTELKESTMRFNECLLNSQRTPEWQQRVQQRNAVADYVFRQAGWDPGSHTQNSGQGQGLTSAMEEEILNAAME